MHKKLYIIFFVLTFSTVYIQAECGYKSCHSVKEDQINIHLVPHSHDDLGWLKTFEQYYYGSHDNIYSAGVQYILSSVVDALRDNKDRRFIYVETGFFWKWWLQQDETVQNEVKKLVNNGQLEFISGGWSMNDEATTYYQNTIDQMTWGLRKLNETFGECGHPKVAWQIDPFGHSREMASIFSQIGFDGFFLNRIDYQDHGIRENNHSLEFVWRGSPDNLGESTDIYTNVLFRHYSAPGGLCFDVQCRDEPIIDDPSSPEYNIASKSEDFVNNWIKPAIKGYASNNILVTMGDDFQYQYAGKNFINMDKLIKYMNSREFDGVKYNVIYSTPSCYLNAVHAATNGTLSSALKTDDFFPYASSSHEYWTGYFSSRPTGKGYGRFSNNFLQVCKQLSSFTNITSDEDTTKLDALREAEGVFQHHDGMTGTEKENVAHDYIRLLHAGITKCEEVTQKVLSHIVQAPDLEFTTCHKLNISECDKTEKQDKLVITVYNPLGRAINKYVRIPIVDNNSEIVIIDSLGTELVTQIMPIQEAVLKTPGRKSAALFDLYKKRKKYSKPKSNSNIKYEETLNGPKFTATWKDGYQTIIGADYYFYSGFNGDSPSTPYIFRPDPEKPLQRVAEHEQNEKYDGPLFEETHVYLNDWFSYAVRHYPETRLMELVHIAGPLPYNDTGIEVIIKFETDIAYDDKINTDSNGREVIERKRDYRPSWDLKVQESIAGNYYPVVTGVTFGNENYSVNIVNDRAQGGGSISYQTFELMLHRNTKKSGQGVGESLNEEAFGSGVVTRGTHFMYFGGKEIDSEFRVNPKKLSQEIYLDSWLFFSVPQEESFEDYRSAHLMEFSALNASLPKNIHLLTMEPWGKSTVLLRLENFVAKDEADSGPSTVNIAEFFSSFKVLSLKETNLSANKWLEQVNRLKFNQETKEKPRKIQAIDDFLVSLDPMEIRTFVLKVDY